MVPESWLQSAGHSNTGDPDQNDFSENVTLIRQIRPDLTRSWVSFCSNSNLSIRRCPISPQVPALRKCNFSFISEKWKRWFVTKFSLNIFHVNEVLKNEIEGIGGYWPSVTATERTRTSKSASRDIRNRLLDVELVAAGRFGVRRSAGLSVTCLTETKEIW